MKVKFINVGRNKVSWEAETEIITYDWLRNQASMYGGLISNDIDFTDSRKKNNDNIDGAYGNLIVGGFRPVGKYYIGKAIKKLEKV
jgi:hypothetical protein